MLLRLLPLLRPLLGSILENQKTTIPGIIVTVIGFVIWLKGSTLEGVGFMTAGVAHMFGMDGDKLTTLLTLMTGGGKSKAQAPVIPINKDIQPK